MKSTALVVLIALLTIGCGSGTTVSDGKGNTVTANSDGTKVTATDDKGNTSTVETKPDGSVKMSGSDGKSSYESGASVSEAELGIATYPGGKMSPNSPQKALSNGEAVYIVSMTSADAPSKVAEFYKPKLKSPQSSSNKMDGGEMESLGGKLDDGAEVGIMAMRNKGETETTIMLTVKRKAS